MTGRPVDIDLVPKSHALLSASSAERWMTCTPSARIEEALQDQETAASTEGTAAHALAELRLRYMLGQTTKDEYVATYDAAKLLYAESIEGWEHSDWAAINEYVEYVLAEAERLDAQVHIEARVDYSRYAEGGFGTSDALLISHSQGTIKSIDLKFGKGVPVSAANNTQAKLYALGGVLMFDPMLTGQFPNIEWTIHQPRLDYVGTDETTFDALIAWAEDVVKPAARLAWEGKGVKTPSEKACRFCKAKASCRERAAVNVNIARRDFMGEPDLRFDAAKLDEHLMGMDEVARILPQLDEWLAWASALKDYALSSVRDRGETIEGYKLVRGRTTRQWNPTKDIPAELAALGIDEATVFEEPKPPAVRSVAQLEKKIGAKEFKPINEGELVVQSQGTPALVPVADKRPAIDPVAEAQNAFDTQD